MIGFVKMLADELFGFLQKPSSVMIYTYRHYCINTGWMMTDGDRSREVRVRRGQGGIKGRNI